MLLSYFNKRPLAALKMLLKQARLVAQFGGNGPDFVLENGD